MDVFRQRLEDEYDSNVIITAPTVPYKREVFAPINGISSHPYFSGVSGQGSSHQQSDGLP